MEWAWAMGMGGNGEVGKTHSSSASIWFGAIFDQGQKSRNIVRQ
jgi:hypothetical protein